MVASVIVFVLLLGDRLSNELHALFDVFLSGITPSQIVFELIMVKTGDYWDESLSEIQNH